MRSRRKSVSALALALASASGFVSLVSGCAPELEVVEEEHLDYAWDPSFEPCAGNAAHMDAALVMYAEYHGVDPAGFGRQLYAWLGHDELEAAYGKDVSGVGGFARSGESYGLAPLIVHELAHLVRFEIYPRAASRLLVEGHAEALEGSGYYPRADRSEQLTPLVERLDPRPFIDGPLPEDLSYYPAAGSFVTYLLGVYGLDPFDELIGRVPRTPSGRRFRRDVERVYGQDLDALVEEFLAATTCPEDAPPPPLPPICAAPGIEPLGASTWVYARTLDCSAEDVVGDREALALHHVTLEIPADGVYELQLFGDSAIIAALAPCGPCPWLRSSIQLAEGRRYVTPLRAGRYALSLQGPGAEVSLAGVAVSLFSDDASAVDEP